MRAMYGQLTSAMMNRIVAEAGLDRYLRGSLSPSRRRRCRGRAAAPGSIARRRSSAKAPCRPSRGRSRRAPDDDADQRRDAGADDADLERDARAVDHPRQTSSPSESTPNGCARLGPSGEPNESVRFRFCTFGPGRPRTLTTSGARSRGRSGRRSSRAMRAPRDPGAAGARTAAGASARRCRRPRRGIECAPPGRRPRLAAPVAISALTLRRVWWTGDVGIESTPSTGAAGDLPRMRTAASDRERYSYAMDTLFE